MRRAPFLFTIGVSLWSAVVAGRQAPSSHCPRRCGPTYRTNGSGLSRPSEDCPWCPRRAEKLFGSQSLDIASPEPRFKSPAWSSIRNCQSVGWSRRGARTITASSTTSSAAPPARGERRCFTGHRTRLESSGAVTRQAVWRQSTKFGAPSLSGAIKGPARFW